jgi:hypothetical protein
MLANNWSVPDFAFSSQPELPEMEEMAWNTSLEEFTHIPDTSG